MTAAGSRGRDRRAWLLLLAGAAVLAAGLVVFLPSRDDDTTPPATASEPAPATGTGEPLRRGGTLDAEAKRVVTRFAVAALGRTDLAAAWDLATDELRAGVTRPQWLRGELPVAPFPVAELDTTGVQVVESSPTKVLLTILLAPRPNTGYVPTRYDMTLVRTSRTAPWKVSYLLPYAPPGMYSNSGS